MNVSYLNLGAWLESIRELVQCWNVSLFDMPPTLSPEEQPRAPSSRAQIVFRSRQFGTRIPGGTSLHSSNADREMIAYF